MLALLSSALLLVCFMICGNISQSLRNFHLPKEYINIHHSTGLAVLKGLWMCVSSFTLPHKHLSSKAQTWLSCTQWQLWDWSPSMGSAQFTQYKHVWQTGRLPVSPLLSGALTPSWVFLPTRCSLQGLHQRASLSLTKRNIYHLLHSTKTPLPNEQLCNHWAWMLM